MEETFEKLIKYALRFKSTDIHFEYQKSEYSISLRTIKGFRKYPKEIEHAKLIEYLKYISNLELTDMMTPQSGSFSYFINGHEYYFRLASISTISYKSLVLRLLHDAHIGVKNKMASSEYESVVTKILNLENGLILYSGSTGSGKTTSLYTLLTRFENKKIYSIEDPIEVLIPGVFQLQIDRNKGFDYEVAIKQILRHDPDVIVIGEIRDKSELSMAISASLTGHLVISTIHAGSCSQTIDRLKNLEISEYDINSQIKYVFNQKLLTVGNDRKVEYEILEL